jgi:hypothetical protein
MEGTDNNLPFLLMVWFFHRNGHALCNDLLTNYAAHFHAIDDGRAKQASGWR